MTISNTATKVVVVGNGAQTTFNYSFLVPSQAEAILFLVDTATSAVTQIAPTAWLLNGAGSPTGGTFTYPLSGPAISALQRLVLLRDVPDTQTTALNNQSGFQPQAIESGLDRIVMMVQEHDEALSRALLVPVNESGLGALPAASQRAGRFLAFDTTPNANPVAALPFGGGTPVTPYMAGVLTSGDANAAQIALGSGAAGRSVFASATSGDARVAILAARGDNIFNARDFGVVADGVTDDSAALASWWAALQSSRRVGILPPGMIRCNNPVNWNLTPNNGVSVFGAANGATVIDVRSAPASLDGGTQFLLSRTAGPTFYGEFAGFSILGNNTTGPTARYGRATLTDEFNGVIFRDIEVKNVANAAGAIALELNGHYNCDFQVLTTNTGGTRVAGTSLRIRRAAFCRFFGSFSGADVGLLIDGSFSFSNSFAGVNIEEVNVGVRFAGSSNSRNVFTAGTFVANTCVDFQSGSGAENMMISPNFGPYSGGSVGTNFNGVSIVGVGAARGGLLVGGLTIPRPPNDATINIDAATGFQSQLLYRRENLLGWGLAYNTANSLNFNRYDPATGTFIETAARFDGTSGDFIAARAQASGRLLVPIFTVAGLPTANPAGQVAYVSNETGGAVLAFSDGTNWRRVTDRAIVT